MSVHYKFKSNLNYDTVTFDGLHISIADLKKSIMQQKKIGKSSDFGLQVTNAQTKEDPKPKKIRKSSGFDLLITNAQTKEVYDNDETLVAKNTSVIVARVPVVTSNKKSWERTDLPLPTDEVESTGHHHFDKLVKNADLVNANASEEDKVKAMISQSSQEYDPSKYVKSRSMTGPLPPSYTCYRCGKQGHWIKNCPTNNLDIKRSTGIPRSFMVPVDGPEHKGALLTSSGEYAVPIIDHEAYKEVKKERPPFLNVTEPEVEPEADIPDHIICMVCGDVLEDAVLIPCCTNSFCDECVRQVLLESDNHECPLCHETDISPDTLIPNRYLRSAVLRFKNLTGYTRAKKITLGFIPQVPPVVSPQPSPESTTENQTVVLNPTVEVPSQSTENLEAVSESDSSQQQALLEFDTTDALEPSIEDTQPGTPLADEPPIDVIPQQETSQPIVSAQQYDEVNNYDSAPGFSQYLNENIDSDSRDGLITSTAHNQISTIVTITNIRNGKYPNRPVRPTRHFPSQRPSHHVERPDNYEHERVDYRERYDRRSRPERPPRTAQRSHPRYERIPRDSRYHRSDNHHEYREYNDETNRRPELNYDIKPHVEDLSRRHQKYASPTMSEHEQLTAPPPYSSQTVPRPQGPLLSTAQPFPPQPPPPGSSPVDSSAQPPPPGVGPLLTSPPPPILPEQPATYGTQNFESEEVKSDIPKAKEMSINDQLDKFARELKLMGYERDRQPRNRSRSHDHERSRSRSYASSKTWSRSRSRTSSRSSRSRSHSSYSSRSRSRSYSHSRSRSRSKSRSYSRSRSRSRSKSRSRSRDRRQFGSRERIRSPIHSNSPSPKLFHPRNRRSPYQVKRGYGSSNYGSTFPSQYGAPPLVPAHNFSRPHAHPSSSHVHSVQPVQQIPNSRSLDHFSNERRCAPYNEQFSNYDAYHPRTFISQRYETRNARFDKHSQEYNRQNEDVEQRIPGWVGERRRDYKPRFRQQREYQRRDIPKAVEPEIKPSYIREIKEEPVVKKLDEKLPIKHKKHHHHHHHQTKEVRKQEGHENRIPVIGSEKRSETPSNLIKVEVISENLVEQSLNDPEVKCLEKTKEKKHKHKKHKTGDISGKKNKVTKKDKTTTSIASSESDNAKVKSKKKKSKLKNSGEVSKKKTKHAKHVSVIENQNNEVDPSDVIFENSDVVYETDAKQEEIIEFDLPVEDKIISDTVLNENLPSEAVHCNTEQNDILDAEVQEDFEKVDCSDIPDDACEANVVGDDLSVNSVDEEIIEDEEADNVLHVELPAISKWEREEYEEEIVKPQRKSAVVQHREEKGSLSNEILQRAEKAILQKPLKTAIVSMPTNREKYSKSERNIPIKYEDDPDEKSNQTVSAKASPNTNDNNETKPQSIVRSKTQESPTLQVTISTDKDKRSVQEKKKSDAKLFTKEESSHSSKRPKLDRSKFLDKSGETNLQRTVVISEADSKYGTTSRHVDRHKNVEKSDRDEKRLEKYSSSFSRQEKDLRANLTKNVRDHRSKETDERNYNNDLSHQKDVKKRKRDNSPERGGKNVKESGSSVSLSAGSTEHVKKFVTGYEGFCKERKHFISKEKQETKDKSRYITSKKSRSSSYDSTESYAFLKHHHTKSHFQSHRGSANDDRRRTNTDKERLDKEVIRHSRKADLDRPKERHESKVVVKDHHKSPTKRREISQDESIFEPNYDQTSESDHSTKADKTDNHRYHGRGLKRHSELPDSEPKRTKYSSNPGSFILDETLPLHNKEKLTTDRISISSSASSSVHTESDSSDSDGQKKVSRNKGSDSEYKHKHKKSKHKKHKKHKHKHKKKKSHRSKQKE